MAQPQAVPRIGEDVSALMPAVGDDVSDLMEMTPAPSHEQDFSQYGPMQSLLKDQATGGPFKGQEAALGGSIGTVVGGVPGALIGGYVGGAVNQARSGTPQNLGEQLLTPATDAAMQAGGAVLGNIVAKPMAWAGQKIEGMAAPLIQRALKPAISELKGAAGQERTSVNQQAQRMANFVKRSGVRTSEQAESKIQGLEGQINEVLQAKNPPTNAPIRAVRYLRTTGQRAANQMNPHPDTEAIDAARQEFVKTSPLFRDAVTQTAREVPSSILDETGQPMMKTEMESSTTRVPRSDVRAREALDRARGTSKYGAKKAFGETKSMGVEAEKALTRAGRDAAKSAVPELRPLLAEEQQLIRLRPVLDRMALRQGNRDVIGGMETMASAPAMAAGHLPWFGGIAHAIRNSQLPAGLMANTVGQGVQRAAPIMGRSAQPINAALLEHLVRQAVLDALGGQQQ